LTVFNNVCEVIDDVAIGLKKLFALKETMENRIALKRQDPKAFQELPYLVIVIDEASALMSGCKNQKALADIIQNLLQRCRHANMSIVLSAQNPTKENLKIDLGSVACRMAFRTARAIQSCTLIDEGGAEDLMEQGDMLLATPQYSSPQRLKGSYISKGELPTILDEILEKYGDKAYALDEDDLQFCGDEGTDDELFDLSVTSSTSTKTQVDDKLFAKVIIWTLGQKVASANLIKKAAKISWDRGNGFLNRLHQIGIVGEFNGNSREVIPINIEDLDEEVVLFLERHDYSRDNIVEAFASRS